MTAVYRLPDLGADDPVGPTLPVVHTLPPALPADLDLRDHHSPGSVPSIEPAYDIDPGMTLGMAPWQEAARHHAKPEAEHHHGRHLTVAEIEAILEAVGDDHPRITARQKAWHTAATELTKMANGPLTAHAKQAGAAWSGPSAAVYQDKTSAVVDYAEAVAQAFAGVSRALAAAAEAAEHAAARYRRLHAAWGSPHAPGTVAEDVTDIVALLAARPEAVHDGIKVGAVTCRVTAHRGHPRHPAGRQTEFVLTAAETADDHEQYRFDGLVTHHGAAVGIELRDQHRARLAVSHGSVTPHALCEHFTETYRRNLLAVLHKLGHAYDTAHHRMPSVPAVPLVAISQTGPGPAA